MDGAVTDAATMPNASRDLKRLIEVLRGRWYLSAPGFEDAVALLEKM